MDDVGTGCPHRHPQIRGQRGDGGVGPGQTRIGLIDRGGRAVGAHAVDVDRGKGAEVFDEFGDVHTGAAIDLGDIHASSSQPACERR